MDSNIWKESGMLWEEMYKIQLTYLQEQDSSVGLHTLSALRMTNSIFETKSTHSLHCPKKFGDPPLTLGLWYIWGDKFWKVVLGSRNFACGPNPNLLVLSILSYLSSSLCTPIFFSQLIDGIQLVIFPFLFLTLLMFLITSDSLQGVQDPLLFKNPLGLWCPPSYSSGLEIESTKPLHPLSWYPTVQFPSWPPLPPSSWIPTVLLLPLLAKPIVYSFYCFTSPFINSGLWLTS